jgi:hypothetical protein
MPKRVGDMFVGGTLIKPSKLVDFWESSKCLERL